VGVSASSGLALTWWGHASATVEIGGRRVATDPVLGSNRLFHLRRHTARPLASAAEADVVLISHLHGDHLDLPSLRRFAPEVPVVVPAGGERLLRRTRRGPPRGPRRPTAAGVALPRTRVGVPRRVR
jgi:L-ascorbate metabolism protein UlaG (beta-lactamase superfamily)